MPMVAQVHAVRTEKVGATRKRLEPEVVHTANCTATTLQAVQTDVVLQREKAEAGRDCDLVVYTLKSIPQLGKRVNPTPWNVYDVSPSPAAFVVADTS
jgi:hypothetical protein